MGRATQTLWLPQPKQIKRIHDFPQGIDGPRGGGQLNDEVWDMSDPGAQGRTGSVDLVRTRYYRDMTGMPEPLRPLEDE